MATDRNGKAGMKEKKASQNKYCNSTDLTNEASVESFFVLRLLSYSWV